MHTVKETHNIELRENNLTGLTENPPKEKKRDDWIDSDSAGYAAAVCTQQICMRLRAGRVFVDCPTSKNS